jgi:hypothetical protein
MNHVDARFTDDKEVETEMWKWLRLQSEDFYAAGFDSLVKRWDKCINVGGGYVENVLRFIPICDLFSGAPSYMDMRWYNLKRTVFCVLVPLSSKRIRLFGGKCDLHLQGRGVSQTRNQQKQTSSWAVQLWRAWYSEFYRRIVRRQLNV